MRRILSWICVGTILSASALVGDRRSTIVVQRTCVSDLWHGDITLYENGTLRSRSEAQGKSSFQLIELEPDEASGYINRIAEIDFTEVDQRHYGPMGGWVDRCTVLVGQEADAADLKFEYLDLSALPRGLTRLIQLIEELEEVVRLRTTLSDLGLSYVPRLGDVLKRLDGELYEVVGFTADGSGVELQGRDSPLVEFISSDQIGKLFVELISRRAPWGG